MMIHYFYYLLCLCLILSHLLYYLEVTNKYKEVVPSDWIRKQTLTNGERFFACKKDGTNADVRARPAAPL